MTDSCYRCGAAYVPQKPARAEFTSEPDYLLACLEWLDYTFPERGRDQSARIAEWQRLEEAADVERIRLRLRQLFALDEWTVEHEVEVDRLTEAWKASKRRLRLATDRQHTKEQQP